jgi:multidrug efflux pump subunit AcrB
MKVFFNFLTTLSLRFRWVVIALVVTMLGLGGVAYGSMQQELLPPIEFPQTIILAQANGMTSQQVSTILTEQLEREFVEIEEIINQESETTGAFGGTLILYNDFGLDQQALQDEIQSVVNGAWHPEPGYQYTEGDLWLPLRGIAPEGDEANDVFVQRLLGDLTPDVLIYLAESNPNFLFQLSPEVWGTFSEETTRTLLAYLTNEIEEAAGNTSALERLVEQEVLPELDVIEQVANVDIAGGQSLDPEAEQQAPSPANPEPLLLNLSSEIWEVVSPTIDGVGALDADAVETILAAEIEVPSVAATEPPMLPESWQFPNFSTADDLLELETITASIGAILSDFYTEGRIIGALATTDDLTANTINNMLALEEVAGVPPEESLLQYFTAEQLLAMPQEAFDALPTTYLDGLDEFTAQQLEAGLETTERQPVPLPRQWQIPAPQLLTFSFADLPLATFSVASTGEIVFEDEPTVEVEPSVEVAPPLPDIFSQFGAQLSLQLNTADDLLNLELPEEFAALGGDDEFGPAELFNFLVSPLLPTFIPDDQLPEGVDPSTLGPLLLGQIDQDVIDYLAENDPNFLDSLSADANDALFSAPATEGGAPPLNPKWTTLATFDPNFDTLTTSDDLIGFPDDFFYENVGDFINQLFNDDDGRGFAPDLLGNWSVESVSYILENEPGALDNLNDDALRLLPDDVVEVLPEDLQATAEDVRSAIVPTTQVTRTNGQESLFVTVYKNAEANTVTTYQDVEAVLERVGEKNDNIEVSVVFEQSSFVENSIEGVAREGGLGAIFAVVIILIFLSSGVWGLRGRRMVGMIIIVLFAALLAFLTVLNLDAAGNDWGEAFGMTDIVFRVLLIVGLLAGVAVLFWPGTLPDPAWRATIVIGVSIPLSILSAFALMYWVSPVMYDLIQPLSTNEGTIGDIFSFVLRLFPEQLTLNIMTLSGLTVAVGRVVDDSIVVLENIFREIQAGVDKRTAVLSGTRDVSAAIFVATTIAVVVFLPLGLTGGIIGAFFLPFGLAVTYALVSSFIVAVTVVPVLAYLTIDEDDIPEDKDIWIADYYVPTLKWSLKGWATKGFVVVLAFGSAIFGFYLFGQRPAAFLPDFGEPQVTVNVELPSQGARITETNALVVELEDYVRENIPAEELTAIQTTVGGGGASFEALLGGNRVAENRANITVGLDVGADRLDERTQEIREAAEEIFAVEGSDETYVTVAAAAVGGDFGGFALVVTGDRETIETLDPLVKAGLESVEGITNVTSNLPEETGGADDSANVTLIRVNQQTALSYIAELETDNTIGITEIAITEVEDLLATFAAGETPEDSLGLTADQLASIQTLPAESLSAVSISQGFDSEIQTEGFNSLPIAMGIALMIVVVILITTFQSLVYWFVIISSVIVAPVGAAIALTLTDRVLGISALIGLLMLLGLVITNAVVLIDRVLSNRNERGMSLYDALVEAGARRLRPILMTSLATIIALTPLAIGLSEGALIASELGTVVIGGVFSSTLLTLIVVPVLYSIFYPVHRVLSFGKDDSQPANPVIPAADATGEVQQVKS